MKPLDQRGLASLVTTLVVAWIVVGCGGGDDVRVVETPAVDDGQAVVLAGNQAPPDSIGQDGQYYIDTQALALYGPRTAGQWPQPPAALVGPPGAPGSTGAAGAGIVSGNGLPSDALGRDGDFYVDLSTSTLFGPKQGGAWPSSGLPLVGPAGPQGPTGTAIFSRHWSMPSNSTFGNGTYYLWPQGPNINARNPVLMPQACTQARLQVATLAVPSPGTVFRFTLRHIPGPELLEANTIDTPLECEITSARRYCDANAAVTLSEGDAIEVRLIGNEPMDSMPTPGSWGIAFTCS
ncbi:MAG: hypothetical protein ACO1OR_03175 [Hydrogenophaga sp.]|jgi:hypothetical protein